RVFTNHVEQGSHHPHITATLNHIHSVLIETCYAAHPLIDLLRGRTPLRIDCVSHHLASTLGGIGRRVSEVPKTGMPRYPHRLSPCGSGRPWAPRVRPVTSSPHRPAVPGTGRAG